MFFEISALLLLLIAVHPCRSTDGNRECRGALDQLIAELLGSEYGCGHSSCVPHSFQSRCEKVISTSEHMQLIGMFHKYESLLLLNHTITIGGHLLIPNLSSYHKRTCDLEKIPKCQKRQWLDDKRWCFYDQQQEKLSNYSQYLLETQRPMKYVSPVVDENWKLLPFPNLFNVTILGVKPLESCHKTRRPIACHMMLNDGCLFRMCHTNNGLKIIQLTIGYEQLTVDLIMTCHLESIENYKSRNPIHNMLRQNGGLDTLCHFASPQTNFYLCDQ